ncbi:helix-turn-helix domain-containing protein [Glaciihabitans sp. INWT7]|uniref:IclR family transcriptional regulator n=1 Tax=Glaciihabitans sp. INWT7 TaxID=2596912 RepID=UPI00162A05D6|nr:helix-turn-helix domain-containing protein [Glaciihabitans sp. INWT7]QNE45666.1 helix-turn-helix domain-containing protein [Glaciihabitans sp. INWT7]
MSSADRLTEVRARQPKAIHSALVVLEEVARCGPGVTAREVSENLGFPRATTYRLLNLLVQEEYLVRLPDLSGFALGLKVVQLAGVSNPVRPPQAVRDLLGDLRATVRGGIHLVRYDEARLGIVDADPDFPLSNPARLTRYLDASAMGRLLLTELREHGTLADSATERPRSEVFRLVAETRERGFAMQVDENTVGYGCLAVPIRDRAGVLVAGLCLSAPKSLIEHPGTALESMRSSSAQLGPLLA